MTRRGDEVETLPSIEAERCSIPVCDQPAAAIVSQEDGTVFLVCERHVEKARAYGFAVRRPGDDTSASEQHELGRAEVGVGDVAPEIRLPLLTRNGRKQLDEVVVVSEVAGDKPVALAFGSYSAPKFRRNLAAVEDVYQRFSDRVCFFLVYTQEVRPESARKLQSGLFPSEPATMAERSVLARRLVDEFDLSLPVLLDRLDHDVTRSYGGYPLRLYLIDRTGRIVYQPPLGPYAFQPSELAAAIEQELA